MFSSSRDVELIVVCVRIPELQLAVPSSRHQQAEIPIVLQTHVINSSNKPISPSSDGFFHEYSAPLPELIAGAVLIDF